MDLINLAPEDLKSKLNIQMIISINNNYKQILNIVTRIINTIWTNPTYTPQQVFDALGSNAASVRSFYIQFIAGLNGTKVGSINFQEPALTVNPDGTITVGK